MTQGPEQEALAEVTEQAIERLRAVYDPEVPVNIYDLGLIYKIEPTAKTDNTFDLLVEMTLTTANCPLADMIPGMVYDSLRKIETLGDIKVDLVWEPPWDPNLMSDEARLALDLF